MYYIRIFSFSIGPAPNCLNYNEISSPFMLLPTVIAQTQKLVHPR